MTLPRALGRPLQKRIHTTAACGRIYDSILDTIGDTPIVRINSIAPSHVTMYAKCEYFNPLSSVKDRLALGIIEDAEKNGKLKAGDTVIEATSGNTGIATAMVCAAKGYVGAPRGPLHGKVCKLHTRVMLLLFFNADLRA